MTAEFESNQVSYIEYINSLFSTIEFELVLYDEVEYFKNYNDPEFDYPYSDRKTKLGSFNLDINITEDFDYEYFAK